MKRLPKRLVRIMSSLVLASESENWESKRIMLDIVKER